MKGFLCARVALSLCALALAGATGCEDSKVAWSISAQNQMVVVVNNTPQSVAISYDRELIDASITFLSLESETILPGKETRIFLFFGADRLGRITVSGGGASGVYVLSRGQGSLTLGQPAGASTP